MNIVNNFDKPYIQNIVSLNKPKNISEGYALINPEQQGRFDTVELSYEGKGMLHASEDIKTEIPREWTISIETLESRINHTSESLRKADSRNLSFGKRLEFLKQEGIKWVEDKRNNDPEMFVEWLKMNKEHIRSGRSDLASLPTNFTMKDYYSYVKEPFSILV